MKYLKLFENDKYNKYKNKVLIDKSIQEFYFVNEIEEWRGLEYLKGFKFSVHRKSANWRDADIDNLEIDKCGFTHDKPFWFYERSTPMTFDEFYDEYPNLCAKLYHWLITTRRNNNTVPHFNELEFKVTAKKYNL